MKWYASCDLNDDDENYRGLNISDLSNYSFSTQVNLDIWAIASKLLLLSHKGSEYAKIMKTTLELQNYHFALGNYVT